MNVLFTSVGRRVELLRAFRSAMETLGIDGRLVAVDTDPLAPALRVADLGYLVPRLDDPRYVPSLRDVCERQRISLVFPLIDPDIPVLSANRVVLESVGARVAVVDERAVAIVADKWCSNEFFRRIRLPAPASWLPGQIDPVAADYPLFIKPRRGSASQHAFEVRNERELRFFLEYVPDPIVQEYLPGAEITSDVVCSPDGELLGIVSRRRIQVRAGEVLRGVTVHEPDIIDACAKIAAELPAAGPITVQCILKDGVAHFTEINARLGGGVPLGIAAGVDAPRLLLAAAAGLDIPKPPLGHYAAGLYATRFDDSLFLTEDDLNDVASRRL
jgi:carbamoyl-phosphate synthase large subunit